MSRFHALNKERIALLRRQWKGKLTARETKRLEHLTRYVEKAAPRYTDADFARLAEMRAALTAPSRGATDQGEGTE